MNIRNFCIIAHIDHGKSTLADRMLELTGTVDKREMKSQLLDSMDLEREKGITIKLTPVQMNYNGHELNLIDTPGHVDFSYEVSRSLQAVEGAILVVDASQGIQAQTLANVYLAIEQNLTIIPVVNKIDLPAANIEKVSAEITNLLGCKPEDIIKVSAKTGEGVQEVLDAVVEGVPAPHAGNGEDGLRALIFDSYFDDYRGVVLYVRVFDGELPKSGNIRMMAAESNGIALEVGFLKPKMSPGDSLREGEIGYIVTNLKTTREAKVGDTVTLAKTPTSKALPGYKNIHPFVYAGFFPVSNDQYKELKEAIEKLSLSDSALQYEPENSPVLGFGLRIGFLGLLHMDIIRERLEREFDLDLVITNPSTDYHVKLTTGGELDIKSASDLPDVSRVAEIREPWIKGEIIIPKDYVGVIIDLVISKRGRQKNLSYIDDRAVINFEAPMANLLTDFYDQLKSSTSGYGSFNYELSDYRAEDLVRIDFYVGGEKIDALSVMAHRSEADAIGRDVTKKLKEVIPRQNFEVALQAAIGARFIARETLGAYRKDVTGYLYGGDVSRKKKLLSKQKKGKARMKRFGKVDIPSEAFTVMLKRG
ncbi:MAG: translation elongation factor 4 [Candidatus Nomurabacteria bacterium]|jgi:GTP-binding protein LepA|nr:translation elongation factor 4 [Candidatus Nomurabacteria bacterium]